MKRMLVPWPQRHGVRAIKPDRRRRSWWREHLPRKGGTVLTVTENGKGPPLPNIDTYRITARGGKGIRNYDALQG